MSEGVPEAKGATPSTTGASPGQNEGTDLAVNGTPVGDYPIFEAALRRAVEAAKRPLPPEMTTAQAADFLDVSPERIGRLTRRGELPCRMVGKRRRIPTSALLAYREKLYQRAKAAADEITKISQELGLYDLEGPPPKDR